MDRMDRIDRMDRMDRMDRRRTVRRDRVKEVEKRRKTNKRRALSRSESTWLDRGSIFRFYRVTVYVTEQLLLLVERKGERDRTRHTGIACHLRRPHQRPRGEAIRCGEEGTR